MARKPRVCAVCKQKLIFDTNKHDGIARLEGKYYHTECLSQLAFQRAQKKNHAEYWDYALENIGACEKDAYDTMSYTYWQDALNDHLLRHYDVMAIPQRFWNIVAELNNGEYRGKRCRPISMQTLVQTWKWAQRNLDEINRYNKSRSQGPQNDAERVNYDLSIVVSKVPEYVETKKKNEIQRQEELKTVKEIKNTINYNSLYKEEKSEKSFDTSNINDLLDAIF